MIPRVALVLAAVLCPVAARGENRPSFDAGRASIALQVRNERIPYRVFAVSALPEESLTISLARGASPAACSLSSEAGSTERPKPGHWRWRAPRDAGLYAVTVSCEGAEKILLNVFVMVPSDRIRDGWLNGYRIGSYPKTPLRGLAIYRPPKGFIEATPENLNTPVSPHFTLGQFLCKQEGGFPKYLVIRERLLLKLEYLLQEVNSRDLRCDTFSIMSGYRTPWYNEVIRNVKYSRHMWGGAADIFIDESPRDDVMDDLNRDGRINKSDAAVLYEIVESQWSREAYEDLRGGLGEYGASAAHGPFVHVDARGFRARWGR